MRQITCFCVADDDSCVLLHQHECHGFAHNIARTDHHHVLTFDRNVLVFQHLLHAKRGAGREQGFTLDECAHVIEVKAVHIFISGNSGDHAPGVKVCRQRQLHENAVHLRVGVQPMNFGFDLRVWRVSGKCIHGGMQTYLSAGLDFVGHIDLGRCVVPHDDDRQPRRNATGFQIAGDCGTFFAHLAGYGIAIDNFCDHVAGLRFWV